MDNELLRDPRTIDRNSDFLLLLELTAGFSNALHGTILVVQNPCFFDGKKGISYYFLTNL